MVSSDKQFAGSIPELYDRYMVPMLFESYAAILADRVTDSQPGSVLETAAGTGVLTAQLARRLPSDARIVATDLNRPMIDQAARRVGPDGRITWQTADATALPFADRSFDSVACQFGAMFFPDKVRGYQEARRVLRPGGHFHFAVWDQIAANEFADVVSSALATVFPHDPPGFMARTPHGYYQIEQIKTDLVGAGFVAIAVETIDGVSKASTARDVAVAFCQGTPLRSEIEARDPAGLDAATEAATRALELRFGQGPVEARMRAHLFIAGS